jgi:hypothetical protein
MKKAVRLAALFDSYTTTYESHIALGMAQGGYPLLFGDRLDAYPALASRAKHPARTLQLR